MGDQPVPHDKSSHRNLDPVDRPVDRRAHRRPPTEVPPPTREGPQTQAPPTGPEVSGRAILPAAVRPCHDRPLPQGQDPQGGGRQVLVVRGRKATDPPPPVHGAQGLAAPDQAVVEGHREGTLVETPKSPLRQMAVEGKVYGDGFGFPGKYKGWVH